MNIDWTLFIYVAVDALVMICNTLLGIAKANKYDEFKWSTLKQGLIKYGLILIAVGCLFLAGCLVPTLKFTLPIASQDVTIIEAMCILAIAVMIIYLKSACENFIELFKITDDSLKQAEEIVLDNGRGDSEEDILELLEKDEG